MTEQEIVHIFEETKALQKGHFALTTGRHAGDYVNKDAVYLYPEKTSRLCSGIAERFQEADVEVVVGPAVGGVILAQRVAEHLAKLYDKEIYAVFADKHEGGFLIKRGYEKVVTGAKTLVVEDILMTGGSAARTLDAVRVAKGEVIGLGVLWNRGGLTAEKLGAPRLEALVTRAFPSYMAKECPLCKEGVPVRTDIGHGAKFLAGV